MARDKSKTKPTNSETEQSKRKLIFVQSDARETGLVITNCGKTAVTVTTQPGDDAEELGPGDQMTIPPTLLKLADSHSEMAGPLEIAARSIILVSLLSEK